MLKVFLVTVNPPKCQNEVQIKSETQTLINNLLCHNAFWKICPQWQRLLFEKWNVRVFVSCHCQKYDEYVSFFAFHSGTLIRVSPDNPRQKFQSEWPRRVQIEPFQSHLKEVVFTVKQCAFKRLSTSISVLKDSKTLSVSVACLMFCLSSSTSLVNFIFIIIEEVHPLVSFW